MDMGDCILIMEILWKESSRTEEGREKADGLRRMEGITKEILRIMLQMAMESTLI